jgi:hypothetical protein
MNKDISSAEFEKLFTRAVNYNFDEMLDNVPSNEELKTMYPASDKQKARKQQLIKLERRYRIFDNIVLWSRRAAVTLAIIFTVGFGALLTFNPEVRATVRNTIIEWFNEFTRFTFVGTVEAERGKSFAPTYIPDSFYQVSIIKHIDTGAMIIYENDVGELLTVLFLEGAYTTFGVDNEQRTYMLLINDGIHYHIFIPTHEKDTAIIVWEIDGFAFKIQGEFNYEELLKVAFSMEEE